MLSAAYARDPVCLAHLYVRRVGWWKVGASPGIVPSKSLLKVNKAPSNELPAL
jgi:hypothetical protein